MKRLILSLISIFSIVFASQATPYTVTSNADAGAGTLRQILATAAGDAAVPHTITFSTAMTITINSDLQINAGNHNGITINGFVDAVDGPDVIIRSSGTFTSQMLFNGTTSASIFGLVFQNLDYGIHFNGATGCVVKGCYFGTNAAGTAIVNGINQAGVYVQNGGLTANNIIGGLLTTLPNGTNTSTNNSERCIFAGCSQNIPATQNSGVRIPALLVTSAGGTQIVNNYFGVDITGTVKLGNGNQTTKLPLAHSNIYMYDAKNSLIDRNVIAGATGSGIHMENWCDNTKIKGNKIGTNAAGTAAYNATTPSLSFSNEACGIFIQSGTGIVIGYNGGTIANERNIIAGNGGAKHNNWQNNCDGGFSDYNQYGIYTESVISSTIKGNYIGVDVTGNSSGVNNVFGNRAGGLKMVSIQGVGNSNSINNIIGGGNTINDRNIISGNGYLWKANDNTSTCNGGVPNPSNMTGGAGLLLQYANTASNTISGNYIGLGADGLTKLGNNVNGIEVEGAASNNIGTPGVPNYICNNTWGIFIQQDFGPTPVAAASNIIAGNMIGVTPTNTAQGNGVRADNTEGGGIGLQMGAHNNSIGTAVANGGNVVSANRIGISIQTNSTTAGLTSSTANTIYNNIIGLDPTGTTAMPNTSATGGYGYGIKIEMGTSGTVFPFNNTIGGTGANQANTISGNQKSGIYINNTTAITAGTANSIVGNNIGTNTAGTAAVANALQGIEIVNVSKTTITSNLISGNTQNGISLTGSGTNTVNNNTIGYNTGKTAPIPNGANGIFLTGASSNTIQGNTVAYNTSNGISLNAASANNIIGGVSAGEPNTINNNGVNGVVVDGIGSINNSIHKNSFSCNLGRGIVLSPSSSGGNGNYAAPSVSGTPTAITFVGPANSTIEVFETDGCATCPTNGTKLQGKVFVVSGSNNGTSGFVFGTAQGFNSAKTYTALAHAGSTTAAHNSSEFSICYTLCQDPTSVTISTSTPTTFCAGGSVVLTATIGGGVIGTPTYVWKNGAGTVVGNAATYTATTSDTYTVTYSSTQMCSASMTSAPITVTVNPKPNVTSAPTGTICSGVAQNYTIASSVPSTYSWSRAAVAGITNAAATNQASNPITEILTNSTASAVDVVYLITPTSTTGSCPGSVFTYTVTVNPKPVVNSPATGAVCSGVAQNYAITSAVGSSYAWTRAAVANITPSTGTGSASPITETLTLAAGVTTAATVTYVITPTSTTGSCAGSPFNYVVTVNPKPVITSSNVGSVCSGTAQNYAIVSNVASSFTWTRASVANISPTTGAGSTSTITEVLNNSSLNPIDVVYAITPTSTTGTCAGAAFNYTVTVNPKPVVNSATSTSVCSGTALNYAITSNVASTYSWTRAQVTGIAPLTGAGSASPITETLLNGTGSPISVVYLITPTATTGSCAGDAFTLTVTVNPKPSITSSGTASVCSNTALNYAITSDVASSYSWTRAAVAGITPATGTGSSNPITETLVSTNSAATNVVYLITPTATTGSCSGDAFTLTVTVNPKPVITSPATASVCSNTALNYAITSNAASTYSWTRATVAGITPAGTTGTANPITETLVSTNSSATNVVYLITPTATAGSCAGDEFTLTVVVNPKPLITSSATASTCSNSVFNYAITSNTPADYVWSRAAVSNVTPATGSGTSSPITETLVNTTLAPINVTYSITPTATTGTCDGDAFTLTVTVNPVPAVTSVPDQLICSGATFSVTPSGVPTGTSYSWPSPTGTDFTSVGGSTGGASSISDKLNNTSASFSQATAVYTVTPSFAGCAGAPFTVTVNIDPVPYVTIGGNTPTCSGTALTLTASISGGLAGTYEWFDVATNQSLATGTTYQATKEGVYTVVFTSTDGAACVGSPTTNTIVSYLPNIPPAIIKQGDSIRTCNNYVELSGYIPSKNYYYVGYPYAPSTGTWKANNVAIGQPLPYTVVGTDTMYNTINVTDLVLEHTYQFVYTVSAIAGKSCGADNTDTITVYVGLKNFAIAASGPSDTLCITNARTLTAQITGGSGSYQYVWASADSSFNFAGQGNTVTLVPKEENNTYYVIAYDLGTIGCSTNMASVDIHAVKSQNLNVPNLLTPNGDNMNDVFFLADKETKQAIIREGAHVEVYNRWGARVYEANNYENNWEAKDLSDGMYYYYIKTPCGNKEYKSWLQILGNKNN